MTLKEAQLTYKASCVSFKVAVKLRADTRPSKIKSMEKFINEFHHHEDACGVPAAISAAPPCLLYRGDFKVAAFV